MDPLAQRVERTLREERMLEPGVRLIVGVSGGADSVALLHLLHALAPAWRLDLIPAHLNHGLRGDESDGDETFVREITQSLGLPLLAGRLGPQPGGNLESRVREARHRFLLEAARERGAAAVALGHHADDAAETMLLNLIRGAGPEGLAGIPPVRPARGFPGIALVRPLLHATRAELRAFLQRQGLRFREDASNRDPAFLRNRIRHQLMPILAEANPAIAATLGRTAAILREQAQAQAVSARDWLAAHATASADAVSLPPAALAPLARGLRLAIFREALRRFNPDLLRIGRRHLEALDRLAAGPTHGRLDLPGLTARRDYERIILGSEAEAAISAAGGPGPRELPLPIPGEVRWCGPGGELLLCSAGPAGADRPGLSAAIDQSRLAGGLRVRGRRPGDRYRPAGMAGRRKLKDVFNQLRVPPADRDLWPLFADEEEIVWVPGMRPAEKAAGGGCEPAVWLSVSPCPPGL
jgi:tRNA(Ile)-lysidine synthase